MFSLNDKVYTIIHTDEDKKEIALISPDSHMVGERRILEQWDSAEGFQVFDGRMYQNNTKELWSTHIDTLQKKNVLVWKDVDVDMSNYGGHPIVLTKDKILMCGNRTSEDRTFTLEWYLLKKVESADVEIEKKTLVISGADFENNTKVKNAIKIFESAYSDYEVEIRDYWEEIESNWNGNSSYAERRKQFNLDLISNTETDIFMGNNYTDYFAMANNGILVDLNEYIKEDKEFQKDDYIELIFSPTNSDGGLYYSFSMFWISGMVIKRENLPTDTNGWSLSELEVFLASLPENITPSYPTYKEPLLHNLVVASFDDLIDLTAKQSKFDTDYFRQMLSFVNTYATSELDGNELTFEEIRNGEILMDLGGWGIMNVEDWGKLSERAGEGMTFAGFPTKGTNHIICIPEMSYAIADGPNKDIAWEFIKIYLANDIKGSTAFSVKKESNEEMFANLMSRADDKGMIYGNNYYSVSVESLRELIETIEDMTLVVKQNHDIYDIVIEEANAYFYGSKTIEEVSSIIQDRVQTKLNELN